MSRAALLRRVILLLKFLSYFSLVPAIVFFLLQQAADLRSSRVEQAMTFIALANEGDLAGARQRLTRPWLATDLGRFYARNPSPAMIAKFKDDVLAASPVSDGDISQLVDYYDTVVLCREMKVCDRTIVDSYFSRPIAAFYCAYDRRLERLARRLNDRQAFRRIADYAGDCRTL